VRFGWAGPSPIARARLAIVRLLLLAFVLQIAAPFAAREPVALAERGLIAVCTGDGVHYVYEHGTDADTPPKAQAKSCAYCLPIFSGHVMTAGESLPVAPRPRLAALTLPSSSYQAEYLHYASSHPRAPPAGALIV